jgi:hypothetical protein
MSRGADEDTLRGYALYRSETPQCNIDSMHAFQFIPYDPVAGFHIRDYSGGTKKYYYFATAISRTNTESPPIAIKDLAASASQAPAPNAAHPDTSRANAAPANPIPPGAGQPNAGRPN